MKALVTGGSGFIGSHVVEKLLEKGVKVRVFDMVMPSSKWNVEFYQGSLLDFNALRMSLNGVDVVFHLAAIADVKDVYNEPYYSEAINVRGTINVLEAIRLTGSIQRMIYGSTTWVYSEAKEEVVDEKTPLSPPSHLYTATKLAGEYYCMSYHRLYNIDVTILRYGIPYGPRARDGAVIPIFVQKALNGEPITIAGDGSQYRKFVYVEDLAEGNVLSLKPIGKNKIYNLDGKRKVTIRELAETIQKIVGNVKIEYIPSRPGDFPGKDVKSELAEKEIGWSPKTTLEEGIRQYIQWLNDTKKEKQKEWNQLDKTIMS